MTPEEVVAKVKDRAKRNFKTGLNCAECVLEAVSAYVDLGLAHETMCLMSGFGGGGRSLRRYLRLPGGSHGGPGGGVWSPGGAC